MVTGAIKAYNKLFAVCSPSAADTIWFRPPQFPQMMKYFPDSECAAYSI